MNVVAKRIGAALPFVLFVLASAMACLSYVSVEPRSTDILTITQADVKVGGSDIGTVELPATMAELGPRTDVVLEFECAPAVGDALLVHVAYAPTSIYQDGRLIEALGQEGSYPSFLGDPPTYVVSVPLRPSDDSVLRLEFQSPTSRDTLRLYELVVGTPGDHLAVLVDQCGFLAIVGGVFVLVGLVLMLFSLFFRSLEKKGRRILYPGTFLFCVGLWQFAENTLVCYLLQQPALLYALSFAGFFCLVIPLVRFAGLAQETRYGYVLPYVARALEVLVAAIFVLQLTGLVPFSRSMYLFHVVIPLVMVGLFVHLLVEGIRRKNRSALSQSAALFVLVIGAVLELANYYLRFTNNNASVFQLTLLAFVPFLAVFAGALMRRTMNESIRSHELAVDVELLERSLDAQHERNRLLLAHEEEVRQQRHDVRHHVNAMRELQRQGRYEELAGYLEQLEDSLPAKPASAWCENNVVSALLDHYVAIAQERGIELDLAVQVPDSNPHVTDADLCIVVGNLVENALDASAELPARERVVTFNVRTQGAILAVYMRNGYAGQVTLGDDGIFWSSKHEGTGVGLRSVRAVAERNDGHAEFEAHDHEFVSSVILRR